MKILWEFLQGRIQRQREKYNIWKLLHSVERESFVAAEKPVQFICDIDKTYLETEFESVLKMAKVALETAADKITVLGATDVLLSARWGHNSLTKSRFGWPRPLHFISSSPPQLRAVLEEKLTMDGLDWSTDTFKNQAYNLFSGRMDLLSHHVGYKSAAILRIIQQAGPGGEFICIGDNAEADSYIYLGIALRLAKKLNVEGYAQFLEVGGVDPKVALTISRAFEHLPLSKIKLIAIRKAPGYQVISSPPLTDSIWVFDDYAELAALLSIHHCIDPYAFKALMVIFHNRYGMSRSRLKSILDGTKASVSSEEWHKVLSEIEILFGLHDNETHRGSDAVHDGMWKSAPRSVTEIIDSLTTEDCFKAAKDWQYRLHRAKENRSRRNS